MAGALIIDPSAGPSTLPFGALTEFVCVLQNVRFTSGPTSEV
jgi:hypothetical protein